MQSFILSIDQGTTSSRALLINQAGDIIYAQQMEFSQYFPDDGWVEHDPNEIWNAILTVSRAVYDYASSSGCEIVAIGITNQRETTVVWDRQTGEPLYNAIVWQDRRTARQCALLKDTGVESIVTEKTGLLLDPYFSATKLAWILDHVPGARDRASRNELAFGTVDSFLIWRLTTGRVHATDATNASRTMLYDIRHQCWDSELLDIFSIPENCLPQVRDSADDFGVTAPEIFGQSIPICGVAGDQQAALIGQACFLPGMIKSTYGTGCFMVMNTGDLLIRSKHKMLTTIAYRINGTVSYALEGSIFIAGAAMQWLRDQFNLLEHVDLSVDLAASLPDNSGVYMVPALTGLGAPHWLPDARGAILGLTRDTGKAHMIRAALESVAYQTADVLAAMQADGSVVQRLRVDGGMAKNSWFCQFLSNILNIPVDCPANTEATALGAAYLAGLYVGLYPSVDSISANWLAERTYDVAMQPGERQELLRCWERAVHVVGQFAKT